ncbi:Queuine tRNA-ribosyltransferase [compost metagenome]
MLGSMLGTIHNLRYYQRFTQDIRDALDNDRFDAFVDDFYARRGLEVPPCPQD